MYSNISRQWLYFGLHKTVYQYQMAWLPKHLLTVETLNWTSINLRFYASSLFLQTQFNMHVLSYQKTTDQPFFSLVQVVRFLSGLIRGMHLLQPMCWILMYVALWPATVHIPFSANRFLSTLFSIFKLELRLCDQPASLVMIPVKECVNDLAGQLLSQQSCVFHNTMALIT